MTLISKKFKKNKVSSVRKNNQSNPKENTDISISNHSKSKYRSGYQSEIFGPDESYRSGFYKEDNNPLNTERGKYLSRIVFEKPETYAQIRLVRKANYDTNKEFAQFEKESNIIPPYTRFFLQQTGLVKQEKYQIVQTFGNFKIFFNNKQPEIKNFSGYLLNSKNNDWLTDFEYVYENYLRGTQAVKLNAITYLMFDNVIVEGYIIMSQFNRTAIDDKGVPFSFQMIITDRMPINLRDVADRNRIVNDDRSADAIIANQRSIPSSALSIIQNFFDSQQIVGVYEPGKTDQIIKINNS